MSCALKECRGRGVLELIIPFRFIAARNILLRQISQRRNKCFEHDMLICRLKSHKSQLLLRATGTGGGELELQKNAASVNNNIRKSEKKPGKIRSFPYLTQHPDVLFKLQNGEIFIFILIRSRGDQFGGRNLR